MNKLTNTITLKVVSTFKQVLTDLKLGIRRMNFDIEKKNHEAFIISGLTRDCKNLLIIYLSRNFYETMQYPY